MSIKKRLFTAAVAAAAVVCVASTAMAENTGVTTKSVNGPVVHFNKYLIMKKQANTPEVTFNFTIEAGNAHDADLTHNQPQVYAGNDASVSGMPTISTAVFTAGQETFQTIQNISSETALSADVQKTIVTTNGLGSTRPTKDEVTIVEGKEAYAKSGVTVDFSGVSYSKPGIYRYHVKETDPSNWQGVTMVDPTTDSNDLYIDVYVNSSDTATGTQNALYIAGSVMHRTDTVAQNSIDANQSYDGGFKNGMNNPETKPTGFVNHYQTNDYTLKKTVTGNQGDHGKYFKFTVTINNAIEHSKYNVDLSNATNSPITLEDGTRWTNPTVIQCADGATSLSQVFWLKDTQSVTIQGIGVDTGVKVEEMNNLDDTALTLSQLGYTVTTRCDTKTDAQTSWQEGTSRAAALNQSSSSYVYDVEKMNNEDKMVEYTNRRQGIIPTGVILEIAPYAALVALALAAIAVLFVSKKKLAR